MKKANDIMKHFFKKNKSSIWIYCLIFLGLCIMFYVSPYTDDDLRWGCQTGIQRLKTFFRGYGGRYLGYLIILAITRSVWLKTLFMAVITGLMAGLVQYISGYRYAAVFSLLSFYLGPLAIFSETFGWASGFANYNTSITFTLLYLAYLVSLFRNQKIESRKQWIFPLFLLGFCNTLIVEHLTLYNLLLSFAVILFLFLKYRKVLAQLVSYSIGCIFGTALMFSNQIYSSIAGGAKDYRKLSSISLDHLISGYLQICRFGFFRFWFINAVLLFVLGFYFYRIRQNLKPLSRFIAFSCLLANSAMLLISIYLGKRYAMADVLHWVIPVSTVRLVTIILLVILLFRKHSKFEQLLFLLGSIVILNAPFLLVRPISPRVFLGSYVMFALLISVLFSITSDEIPLWENASVKWILTTLLLIYIARYSYCYHYINQEEQQRLAWIREQAEQGATSVTLYKIGKKYPQYVKDINPKKKFELAGYKRFYHLPKKLKLLSPQQTKNTDRSNGSRRNHKKQL